MTNISVTKKYNTEASKIWTIVSRADSMDKYLPSMITACKIDDNKAGSKRVCSTEQGDIHETILVNNDEEMKFQYSIDNEDAPLPVKGYIGTATVKKITDSEAELSWAASFEPKGMPETEVVGMLEAALGGLMDNINAAAQAA